MARRIHATHRRGNSGTAALIDTRLTQLVKALKPKLTRSAMRGRDKSACIRR
jgi:hypothetical protein